LNPRICKIALVASVGFFFLVVTLNDAFLDYRGNYALIQHILSMDTLNTGEQHAWRALRSPVPGAENYWLHHVFYLTVILWNAVTCVLCFVGAAKLWAARKSAAAVFNQAKNTAFAGLTINLLLWLVALMAVAGEWFLMWQSKDWNEQDSAFRMFACLGIVLVFLALEDKELPAA
jgi:predicted small integral membrane protein